MRELLGVLQTISDTLKDIAGALTSDSRSAPVVEQETKMEEPEEPETKTAAKNRTKKESV